MSFEPTPHAVLGLPDAGQAVGLGEKLWAECLARREQIIAAERNDPFLHCWEPPIWWVCDCLMGFPWVPAGEAEPLRRLLGFAKPAPILLIVGGQRGGKSEYAAHRLMRVLRLLREEGRAWALHSNLQMSRDYQQALIQKFLPRELKGRDIKSRDTYVAYKQKTGFSEEKLVLPPARPGLRGADLLFKTYDQDVTSIEGGNLDIIWPDELVPMEWVETMELRIAERNGWMPITFTPVQGYSETVRLFQDGAEVVRESVAFVCPKDGGPPDVARALGLTEEELAEVKGAEAKDEQGRARASLYPQSRPEDCRAWLAGESGQPAIPAGREFERVPRVMRCADPEGKRAVVFFHSSDNPYGNPKNVWGTIAGKSGQFIKERFYGIAHKTFGARFTKFNRNVHVVPAGAIPREGTNYELVDPCGGRNLFAQWFRVTPEHAYLYREWPGNYYIPGIGVPGPWALPDGRHPDGKRGPGQKSFGWGLLRYKEEFARLERWKDWEKSEGRNPKAEGSQREESGTPVADWDERNGSAESIQERYLDSRFASTPRMEKDRPVTLMTEFEEIGLFFTPTPGDEIEEGAHLITNALDYDESKPVDYFNQPRLLISAECVNTIYALTTWTGLTREGRRCLDGATKDPIDLLRYFLLSECAYVGGRVEEEEERVSDFENPRKEYY